jgi:hypothetical protein
MRLETRNIVTAFMLRTPKKEARTHTDGNAIYLHGNKIAWRNADGSVSMTLANWGSVTTRERLNGLCERLMNERPWHQKAHTQYFNEREVEGSTIITVHPLPSVGWQ